MSLSVQDREILLQEIHQIQQTLEAGGRSFDAYSSEEESDHSSNDDSDDANFSRWNPVAEVNEDEEDSKSFFRGGILAQEDVYSPDGSVSRFSYNTVLSNRQQFENDPNLDLDFADREMKNILKNISEPASPQSDITDSSIGSIRPVATSSRGKKMKIKIDLNSKLKARFKKGMIDLRKNIKNTAGKKTLLKSEDGGSTIDISVPPSLVSLPEKSKQQINMTNLYVERIFREYRRNKNKLTPSVHLQDQRFDSRKMKSSANLGTLENLLQVNRQYQEHLNEELKKVQLAIARNTRSQDELTGTDGEKDDPTFSNLLKSCIGRFGYPYFKDSEGMGPPDNEDTKQKKINLVDGYFPKPSKQWRGTETKSLKEGVYHNILEKKIEPLLSRLKVIDKDIRDVHKADKKDRNRKLRSDTTKQISNIKNAPEEDMLKDTTVEIDFFKISKIYLPARNDFECRLQWFNVIHPSINQSKFTKDEDSQLIKLAKKYDNHHWELISKELGTNRTPVQCLQRYQRSLNKDMIKNTWTEEDDKKLTEAVRLYGNYWVAVADYMGDRLSDQCMFRWEKTVNPKIKRGKWTEEEDKRLIDAVKKYGTSNWKTVKHDVPGRTDSQCRERYVSSLDPTINSGPFTYEEDEKLLLLVKKYGTGKWAKITTEFPGRRDHQIWRRYKQIGAEDYHRYRRENLWKKGSVMTYFLHRDAEKREYEMEELDVQYIPSINNTEARKLQLAKYKLANEGLSPEEITQTLARMHFNGYFSKSKRRNRELPKRRARSTAKTKITATSSDRDDFVDFSSSEEENDEKEFGKQKKKKSYLTKVDPNLISEISQIISTVDNPKRDFDSPPPPNSDSDDEILFIQRPDDPGKRKKRYPIFRMEEKLCIKLIDYKCEEILRKYRQQITLLSEAQSELEMLSTLVEDRGKNKEKVVMMNIVEEYKEKLKILQNSFTDVQMTIVSQNDLEVSYKAKSKRNYISQLCKEKKTSRTFKKSGSKRLRIKQEFNSDDEHDTDRTKTDFEVSSDVSSPLSKKIVPAVENSSESQVADPSVADPSVTSQSVELNLQLRTFTLLLQALHIDTNAVMKTLPESRHLADSCPTIDTVNKPFPTCYPLSPNVASLRGFRSLLLHRRVLADIVKKQYPETEPDRSYRESRSYEALRKRFQSIFMWPAFLATFIPKHAPEKPERGLRTPKSKSITGRLNNIRKNHAASSNHSTEEPRDFVKAYMEQRKSSNEFLNTKNGNHSSHVKSANTSTNLVFPVVNLPNSVASEATIVTQPVSDFVTSIREIRAFPSPEFKRVSLSTKAVFIPPNVQNQAAKSKESISTTDSEID